MVISSPLLKKQVIISTLIGLCLLIGATFFIAYPKLSPLPILRIEQPYKQPKAGLTSKEGATDIPSWAKGEKPLTTESGRDFAKRLLDNRYGNSNYPTGPASEFNKLKKYADRHFE